MITTVGKQLAEQIVDTVHDVCGYDINFINKNGIIYASTNTARIDSFHEIGKKVADTRSVIEVQEGDQYKEIDRIQKYQEVLFYESCSCN